MLCTFFYKKKPSNRMKSLSVAVPQSAIESADFGVDVRSIPGSRTRKDESSRKVALLFAIVLLSALMVSTCLGFLALSKSQYGWRLLTLDLIDESLKTSELTSGGGGVTSNDSIRKVSSNEEKLIAALQYDLMKSSILYILCWLGSINCIATFVLVYGIFIRSYGHMLAWSIVSIVSLVACVISMAITLHEFRRINYCTTVPAITLILLLVYAIMMLMICQYIRRMEANYKRYLKTLAVKTYAGCVHRLSITKAMVEKGPQLISLE